MEFYFVHFQVWEVWKYIVDEKIWMFPDLLLLCFRKYIICEDKPNSQVLQCAFMWIWAAKTQSYFPRRVSPVTCTCRCVQSQTRAPCRSLPSPSSPCPSETSECSRSVLPRVANRDGWGENLISAHDPGSRWVSKGMLEQNFYHFSFFLFGFAGRWRRNGQLPGKDTAVPLASYTMTLNHRI